MNLVADEDADAPVVERLRQHGHQVSPDDVVLALAHEQQALLLTADKDFGELVFRQRHLTSRIVLIRLAGLSLEQKAAVVAAPISEHEDELAGNFAVIAPGTIRVRRSLHGGRR